jgi:hypothetical protein
MATTTNFGWETPDDTDLVKDGAAAIRTALGGVDTSFVDLKGGTTGQVLSKASNTDLDFSWVAQDDSNAIQNAIVDAKGDLISATAADTPARLAVGANNTVLTADSSTATGLKWATPATGGTANWSLVNAGGTALTGAATVTVSGISGANQVMIVFVSASCTSASSTLGIRINADTTTKYDTYGTYVYSPASYVTGGISQNITNAGGTYIPIGIMSGADTSAASGYCLISGGNAAGIKTFQSVAGFSRAANDSQQNYIVGGLYTGTSTISSVSMYSPTSNFDAGTVYVYTTA